ncbi:glycoside hydrolase family 32 protein [Terrabacter sp. MAHUQ-38]|uniref:glycoside hydrolase family 32 protein n=1 Tax=unclassified Terrabacter TaxID=2630222 RepID=UPI00165D6321|nr:glycoside hydrolase family 32 protein [Terrabacter sp. MAHUQ-38]MBC9823946.1 glycoside hydrolase family 32 protein [Terrabacter sp. MAHUQ-38]
MSLDRHRPGFHYTPARNWLNDPNGLVWYDGEYHLFYQYNPHETDWGNMSWGHAVSPDLVSWVELPVAIPFTETEHVFSGSVVIDHRNTSGFGLHGAPAMVAIYTTHDPSSGRQAQALAVSHDRGRSWSRYAGNPVLDVGSSAFRDPKVSWYEAGGYWVMVVAHPDQRIVQFYASGDLRNWRHLSDFGPAGATAGIWECPDLFPLRVEGTDSETAWVLVVSVGDGAVAGGSGVQYFLGDFDGTTFTLEKSAALAGDGDDDVPAATWLDFGADYYASVSFGATPDGERVLIGWMSNWAYAAVTPADGFRGAMSVPRVHRLVRVDGRLRVVQQPVPALESLRSASSRYRHLELDSGDKKLLEHPGAEHLEIYASFIPRTASRFGIRLRGGEGEETEVGYDAADGSLYVDRTRSGQVDFHPQFPGTHRAPLILHGGRVIIRLLVDVASLEVFGGIGESVITDQIFPNASRRRVELFAEHGTVCVDELRLTSLNPVFPSPAA